MKPIYVLLFIFLLAPLGLRAQSAGDIQRARDTKAKFIEKDPGLQTFFDQAQGYAIFTSVGKGAIGIGGAYSDGVLFEGNVPIGKTKLVQVTIGFQLGGQAYSEVVFLEDEAAMTNFKYGDLKLSAQVSAVAVTLGASADAAYRDGVAVFTMTKGGLMYEASVGGQAFTFTPKN